MNWERGSVTSARMFSSDAFVRAPSACDSLLSGLGSAQLLPDEQSTKCPSSPASPGRKGLRHALSFHRTLSGHSTARKAVRGIVSKNKRRFQEDGYDLDLTYITPRVIAMGFPASGAEAQFRNPLQQVEKLLQQRHAGRFRVYNLCEERRYDTPARFSGHHTSFPFRDHNPPVPFSLIPMFCADAAGWLAQHPANVVAVHCKAGKGRTGVMCSSLALHRCYWATGPQDAQQRQDSDGMGSLRMVTAAQALQEFDDARTHDSRGVTIASQIRYVHYYESVLKNHDGQIPPERMVRIDQLILHSTLRVSGLPDAYFVIEQGSKEVGGKTTELFDSRKHLPMKSAMRHTSGGKPYLVYSLKDHLPACHCVCGGDVLFRVKAKRRVKADAELFHFWLNFDIGWSEKIILSKKEIDRACKDRRHEVYPADLSVELFTTAVGMQSPASDRRSPRQSFHTQHGGSMSTRAPPSAALLSRRVSASSIPQQRIGALTITSLSVRKLSDRPLDVYMIVRCPGNPIRKTEAVLQSMEPVFRDTQSWTLGITALTAPIVFEVRRICDREGREDVVVGAVSVSLTDIVPTTVEFSRSLPGLSFPFPLAQESAANAMLSLGAAYEPFEQQFVSPTTSLLDSQSDHSHESPIGSGIGASPAQSCERTPTVTFSPDPLLSSPQSVPSWRKRPRRVCSVADPSSSPQSHSSPDKLLPPSILQLQSKSPGAAMEGVLSVRRQGKSDEPKRAWCKLIRHQPPVGDLCRTITGECDASTAELQCFALPRDAKRVLLDSGAVARLQSPTSFTVAGYEMQAESPKACERWLVALATDSTADAIHNSPRTRSPALPFTRPPHTPPPCGSSFASSSSPGSAAQKGVVQLFTLLMHLTDAEACRRAAVAADAFVEAGVLCAKLAAACAKTPPSVYVLLRDDEADGRRRILGEERTAMKSVRYHLSLQNVRSPQRVVPRISAQSAQFTPVHAAVQQPGSGLLRGHMGISKAWAQGPSAVCVCRSPASCLTSPTSRCPQCWLPRSSE